MILFSKIHLQISKWGDMIRCMYKIILHRQCIQMKFLKYLYLTTTTELYAIFLNNFFWPPI